MRRERARERLDRARRAPGLARRRHEEALEQRPRERPPEGLDPADRRRAERLAVEGVLERHEAAAAGPAVLRPVLERELQRDLDGRRAVVAVEDVLEAGRRDPAQRLGELRGRRVRDAGERRVPERIRLAPRARRAGAGCACPSVEDHQEALPSR